MGTHTSLFGFAGSASKSPVRELSWQSLAASLTTRLLSSSSSSFLSSALSFTPPRPRPPSSCSSSAACCYNYDYSVICSTVVRGPPPLYYHFDTLLMFSYRQMTHAPGQVAMDLTCRFKCCWCSWSWRKEVQLCCCSYHQCLSFLSPPESNHLCDASICPTLLSSLVLCLSYCMSSVQGSHGI